MLPIVLTLQKKFLLLFVKKISEVEKLLNGYINFLENKTKPT